MKLRSEIKPCIAAWPHPLNRRWRLYIALTLYLCASRRSNQAPALMRGGIVRYICAENLLAYPHNRPFRRIIMARFSLELLRKKPNRKISPKIRNEGRESEKFSKIFGNSPTLYGFALPLRHFPPALRRFLSVLRRFSPVFSGFQRLFNTGVAIMRLAALANTTSSRGPCMENQVEN